MPTGFAVEFSVGAVTLNGLCRDVSEAGIRAEFDGTVTLGASGVLFLHHPIGKLQLQAKAAYIETCQVGLVFLFQNDRERQITSDYMISIRSQAAGPPPIEFP